MSWDITPIPLSKEYQKLDLRGFEAAFYIFYGFSPTKYAIIWVQMFVCSLSLVAIMVSNKF